MQMNIETNYSWPINCSGWGNYIYDLLCEKKEEKNHEIWGSVEALAAIRRTIRII